MKKNKLTIKNLVTALLLLSFVAFVAYNIWHYMTRDVEPPRITMDKEAIEVSIKADEEELLKGVKATDAVDGDVSATLGVEKLSAFDKEGSRRMSIVAFDNNGNIARAIRKVKYKDYEHPRFTLENPLRLPIMNGQGGIRFLINARDSLDGDITDRIAFRYEKDDSIEKTGGDFPVTFEVTNSAGDKQKIECTATLFNQNTAPQTPTVALENYIAYTKVGEELDPMDYVKFVRYIGREYKPVNEGGSFRNGGGTGNTINREYIEIDDDEVDYDKPGSYEISYSVTDDIGNKGTVRLIVVVEEDSDD